MRKAKRSEEGSIERALEESWYPTQSHDQVLSIYLWLSEDATQEFSRTTKGISGCLSKSKWLAKIKSSERIIKSRLNEALFSDSRYVRTYAELLLNQSKIRKENAKLRRENRKTPRAISQDKHL